MNRTFKAATIKRYHYASLDDLDARLQTFLTAYNYAKTQNLERETPFEVITAKRLKNSEAFRYQPNHLVVGLGT